MWERKKAAQAAKRMRATEVGRYFYGNLRYVTRFGKPSWCYRWPRQGAALGNRLRQSAKILTAILGGLEMATQGTIGIGEVENGLTGVLGQRHQTAIVLELG